LAEEKKTKKRRWGTKRWIVLLLIILGIFGARAYYPIQPHVQLPAEELTKRISLGPLGEVALTNTIVAMVLVDILVIILALLVRRAIKHAEKEGYVMARGIPGVIEAMFEYLYDMTETTAGKWAKQIFPFFASITLIVLIANWMELIPGVDSIGLLHHSEHGYAVQEIAPGVSTIIKEEVDHGGYGVIPFVRVLSTDLNFTIALALVSVIMTQVIGIRSQGLKYFNKFWNIKFIFKINYN